MITLAKVISGSKLYRLDNPLSDTDYKGIFLPSEEDCLLLCAVKNRKESSGEGAAKIEYGQFALQEFIRLAVNAEDVAITMLHCNTSDVLQTSEIFQKLCRNRSRFYTKKMAGSLEFAKSQAVKYALRADRLLAVERVIGLLEEIKASGAARLSQCWDLLTEGEHVTKEISQNDRGEDKRVLNVSGKLLPATITPDYALGILCKLRDRFGNRVRAAKEMSGQDMKAIYQSFRVGYQLRHIYKDGTFSYPLPESAFLRDVKENRLHYINDRLDERLNELIAEVEELVEASSFPDSVNARWLRDLVLEAYASQRLE